jgi:hypothetical protein
MVGSKKHHIIQWQETGKKRKEKEKVVHSFSVCYRRWELYQVLLEFIALSNV